MSKEKEARPDPAAAAIAAATGEPIQSVPDEEGEAPPPYDPEAFAEEAEAAETALEEQGRLESNPGGTAGLVDRDREARAEAMQSDPLAGLTAVQRAQYEKFGTLPANITPPNAGMGQMAPMMQAFMQMMAAATGQNVDALGIPGMAATGPTEVEMTGEFVLVSTWGGRVFAQKFTDLRVMQGYMQKAPGEKRIFKAVPGQADMQEINGLGHEIVR